MNKKINYRKIITLSIILMFFGSLFLSAIFGIQKYYVHAASLDTKINGLGGSYDIGTWSSTGTTITGSIGPSSTTSCGSTTYSAQTATLTITNNSGSIKVLSYTISVSGSGSYSHSGATNPAEIIMPSGSSETFKVTSAANKNGTTIITISNITFEDLPPEEYDITFKIPEHGSYTVDNNIISSETTIARLSNESFSLVATPDINYQFDGWYINNELYSKEKSIVISFFEDSSVEARFILDPLFSIATLSEGHSGESIGDYVIIDSANYHSSQHSWHSDTYVGGPKDSILTTYFDDPSWSVSGSSIVSSTSGRATGDEASGAERSWSTVNIYSDIIRIQALQDCKISFKDTLSGNNLTSREFYTHISSSPLSGNYTDTVKTAANKHSSGSTVEISLAAGTYLYILSYGYENGSSLASTRSVNYTYSSTISNFTIIPDNTRYNLTITYEDNLGNTLGAGKIKIGDNILNIGSNGQPTTTYENVGGSNLTLSINALPTNYVFLYWKDITKNTTSYTATYDLTLNENRNIKAVFAPAMTITAGGSGGLASASYQYKNISNVTTTSTGQYVARNTNATSYYSTLADAFAANTVVVLLAGDTFNGDFTVPSGKTLVIPCGMLDKGPTTPAVTDSSAGISNYAVVTINGNWTIDGTLVVSATQGYNVHGRPVGTIGRINMSETSSMIVNGKLYAFGCIYGGSITTGNSAEVHELMYIGDMANAVQMYYINNQLKSKKVFPFSNYFIRNIEAPVIYVAGSKLIVDIATQPAVAESYCQTTMPVIGSSSSMFVLSSGTITKSYDRANDQTLITIDEGASVSTGYFSISITLQAPMIGNQTVTLNTRDYYLPLCSAYHIIVNGNLDLSYYYKLLPGAFLDIGASGTMTITSGSELVLYRMNDYDGTTNDKFSVGGCPINSYRFTSPSTYNNHTAANTGSAKLNVDGVLNVNGGLYVTNDLVLDGDSNQLYSYSNGYNMLTGIGKIDMSSASTSTSSIYEVKLIPNSNDISSTEVSIVSIKGLTTFNATIDNGYTNYTSLTKNVWYGFINDNNQNVWSLVYIVTFNMKGYGDSIESVVVPIVGRKIEEPDEPSAEGVIFKGWYKEDECINIWDFSNDIVNSDTILFAKWVHLYIITFYDEDGETILKEATQYEEGTASSDIVKPSDPTKAESPQYTYTFAGWSPIITNVISDAVYFATYTPTPKSFTITYYLNNGVHSGEYDEEYTYSESNQDVAIGSGTYLSFTSRIALNINGTVENTTLTIPAETYGDITVTWMWQISMPDEDDTTFIYNGLEQTYVVDDSIAYSVSNNKRTSAGIQNVSILLNTGFEWSNNENATAELQYEFNINPATLNVTANNQIIIYGDLPIHNGVTYTGFVNNETVSVIDITNLDYDYSYNQYDNVGNYTITPKGLEATNYCFDYNTGTLTVNPKEIGLSWGVTELTYNGVSQVPSVSATGLVNNDEVLIVVTGGEVNVGSNYTAVASSLTGDKASNYILPNDNSISFIIIKAPLSIIANNNTIIYGDLPIHNGVSYDSFVAEEDENVLNGTLTYAYNYSQYDNIGTYTITPSGLTSDNYDITFVNGQLIVNPKEVILSWSNDTFTYDGLEHVPSVIITGLVNDDVISSTVEGAEINAGSHTATASSLTGEKADNYIFPTLNTQTFTILPKDLYITADDVSKTYGNDDPLFTYSYEGLIEGDSIFGSLARAIGEAVGIYLINIGTLTAGSNYSINYISANLTINQAILNILATASSKTYGDDDPLLAYTYEGLVEGDSITGALARAVGEDVGDYLISIGTLTAGNNYIINYTSANFTINKRFLTLTADSLTITYYSNAPDYTYEITSGTLISGEYIDSLSITSLYAKGDNVGNYVINISDGIIKDSDANDVTSNYQITYINGNLEVVNANLSGSLSQLETLTYNGIYQTPTIQDNLVTINNQSKTITYATSLDGEYGEMPTYKDANTYTVYYKVIVVNHNEFYGTFEVVINPATLNVTANNQTIIYGDLPIHNGVTYTGFVNNETVSVIDITNLDYDYSYNQYDNVGNYTITPKGLEATNYCFDYNTGTLTVNPKEIGLSWGVTELTYNGVSQVPSVSATGLVNNDEVLIVVTGGEVNVGSNYTAVASSLTGDKASNYILPNDNSISFIIIKAPLSIIANNNTIIYGDLPIHNGVSYDSFVAEEDENVLNGTLTYAYNYSQYDNIGTYTITPSGLTSDNYDITFVDGQLIVNPKEVILSWSDDTFTYDGNPHIPSVSITNLCPQDSTDIVVVGEQTSAGNYIAYVDSISNSNYQLPINNTKDFIINKASLRIEANNQTITYYTLPQYSYQQTGLINNVDIIEEVVFSSSYVLGSNVGSYDIIPTDVIFIEGSKSNYEIEYINGILTVNNADLTNVSIDDYSVIHTGSLILFNPSKSANSFNDQEITWEYRIGSDNFATSLSQSEVGEYIINYRVSAPNHNLIEGSVKFIIKYQITFINNGHASGTIDDVLLLVDYYDISYNFTPDDGYYFVQWIIAEGEATINNNSITNISSNLIVQAIFDATRFTITWKNYDGTILKTDTDVTYGSLPTYDGSTPTKDPTVANVYTFNGWTPNIVVVTNDAIYTATFLESIRKYSIKFYNYDGTLLSSQSIDYNSSLYNTVTNPTIDEELYGDNYFVGWSQFSFVNDQINYVNRNYVSFDHLGVVTGDMNYIAEYVALVEVVLPKEYDEDFNQIDVFAPYRYTYSTDSMYLLMNAPIDGTYINSILVEDLVVPDNLRYSSYYCDYLLTDSYFKTSDFYVNQLRINNEIDSNTFDDLLTDNYLHGQSVIICNALYTLNDISLLPNNITLNENNVATITWYDDNDHIITNAKYGDNLYYVVNSSDHYHIKGEIYDEENIIRTFTSSTITFNTNQFSFSLVSDNKLANIKTLVEIELDRFTITFEDGFNNIIKQEMYDYGVMPTCEEPTHEGYDFISWNSNIVVVLQTHTYIAIWDISKYVVTLVIMDDNTYGSVNISSIGGVPHGSVITVSNNQLSILDYTITATPSTNNAQYSYSFDSWSVSNNSTVTSNLSINVYFNRTINKYLISWLNYDGTELLEEEVEYGVIPEYSGTPTKPQDEIYNYSFSSWSPTITIVTENKTYIAQFSPSFRTYLIHYTLNGGTHTGTYVMQYTVSLEAQTLNIGLAIYDNHVTKEVISNKGTISETTLTIDGSTNGTIEIIWYWYTIVNIPSALDTVFIYNGEYQTYNISENDGYIISGNTEKDANSYIVKLILNENYIWSNLSFVNQTYSFIINPKSIGVIWSNDNQLVYNGNYLAPTAIANSAEVCGNDNVGVNITGQGLNVGSYTATATSLNSNYLINSSKSFDIVPREVVIEWSNLDLKYNGSNQLPIATATNVLLGDSVAIGVTGDQTGKNVGEHFTAVASSISNSNYKLPSDNSINTEFKIYFLIQFDKGTKGLGIIGDDKTYSSNYNISVDFTNATGYLPTGWEVYGCNAVVDDNVVSNITNNIILTRLWRPIVYHIIFNANYDTYPMLDQNGVSLSRSGQMVTQDMNYDTSYNLNSCAFSFQGYTFMGWTTTSNKVESVNNLSFLDNHSVINLSSTDDAIINLYAQWSIKKYIINFNVYDARILANNRYTMEFDIFSPFEMPYLSRIVEIDNNYYVKKWENNDRSYNAFSISHNEIINNTIKLGVNDISSAITLNAFYGGLYQKDGNTYFLSYGKSSFEDSKIKGLYFISSAYTDGTDFNSFENQILYFNEMDGHLVLNDNNKDTYYLYESTLDNNYYCIENANGWVKQYDKGFHTINSNDEEYYYFTDKYYCYYDGDYLIDDDNSLEVGYYRFDQGILQNVVSVNNVTLSINSNIIKLNEMIITNNLYQIDNNHYVIFQSMEQNNTIYKVGNNMYVVTNGEILKNQFFYIDNPTSTYYYCIENNTLKKKLLNTLDHYYYLDANGVMNDPWEEIDNNA